MPHIESIEHHEEPTPAEMHIRRADGSRTVIPLTDPSAIIGRHPKAAIRLNAPYVSRTHARLRHLCGLLFIEDLSSKNGLRVNGARLKMGPLAIGDRVQIGDCTMVLRPLGCEDRHPIVTEQLTREAAGLLD